MADGPCSDDLDRRHRVKRVGFYTARLDERFNEFSRRGRDLVGTIFETAIKSLSVASDRQLSTCAGTRTAKARSTDAIRHWQLCQRIGAS